MALASYDSVGIHAAGPDLDDVYVNGEKTGRWRHNLARIFGTGVTLAVYGVGSGGVGGTPRPRVDRIEFRDGPDGTLLGADDFLDLSAWTFVGSPLGDGATNWVINPSSFIYHASGSGSAMYLTADQPPGTTYVELQGVTFENAPSDNLLGIAFDRNYGNDGLLGGGASGVHAIDAGNVGRYLIINATDDRTPTPAWGDRVVGGWNVGRVGWGYS